MEQNQERIKDLQYSFSSFFWRNIIGAQEKWDEGDVYGAIYRALGLVIYLPIPVKKQLEKDRDKIQNLLNGCSNLEAHDFQTTMLLRDKQLNKVARHYFPEFINKMMTLLDKRGYLERGLLPAPKYANPKKPLGAGT
jgi:hypothetical protein